MSEYEWKEVVGNLRKASAQEAGSAVEARVLDAFRARHRRRTVWRSVGSLAASVIVAAGLYFGWSRLQAKKPVAPIETSVFIALPYSESGVPLEQAVIVRMSVPASTLASLGMRLPLAPEKNVNAELLVGQDGVARAVRIVQ